MLGFVRIIYAVTLLFNAGCILNEERFLHNIGVGPKSRSPLGRKAAELVRGIKTVCAIPLIILNLLFMIYELILG